MSYKKLAAAALVTEATGALAQAVGFATLPPGSLNHTTASAVAKVLKERAGINMLVQPTAGDNVIIPMVNRGESIMGIANAPETAMAIKEAKQADVRLLAVAHTLQTAFFVRKDSRFRTLVQGSVHDVCPGHQLFQIGRREPVLLTDHG